MIPAALSRVSVVMDTESDAAAVVTVDYSGGRDHATVRINPDIAPPESVSGYELRGAVMAALERIRRYNRTVTRRYGTYSVHQMQFEIALADVAREIEELIHAYPYPRQGEGYAMPTRPAVRVTPSRTTDETPITAGFPFAYALAVMANVSTLEQLSEVPDSDLAVLNPEQIAEVRAAAALLTGERRDSASESAQTGAGGPADEIMTTDPQTPPPPAEGGHSAGEVAAPEAPEAQAAAPVDPAASGYVTDAVTVIRNGPPKRRGR